MSDHLAAALKALGINPDDNPAYHAKRWIEGRDSDRRERDQALTERDNLIARVAARDLRIKDLESALGVIADLVSAPLGCADLAGIYGRVKDVCTERDGARTKIASNVADLAARDMRIAELEREIEGTHKVFDGVGVTWSTGLDAGRLPLVKRAAFAVEPGFLADAERKALEARIADLERDLAAKDAARSDAIKMAHAAAKVSADLAAAEIGLALDDAGAPAFYDLPDDTECPIPDPERIRILGERLRSERGEREQEALRAQRHADYLRDAHIDLDDRNAPRLADGCVLSLAARIRSIPR